MKRLTITVAAIALTAGAAYAQSAATDETKILPGDEAAAETGTMEKMENAADATMTEGEQMLNDAGEAISNTAEAAGEAITSGADAAGDAIANAADQTGEAMQNVASDAAALFAEDEDGLIRTRDITGGVVYAIDADGETTNWDEMASYDSIGENWDNVGEIEDIVLASDGSFEGIVAEVGGFLDLGDKHVHLSMQDVKLVPVDEDRYAVVTNFTKQELMDMPNVDESFLN
ncbi:PRC-barrel domain-containing protein [Salipiger sp. P9]|uniref:PRC-barrel domain-containing protein n=1 Tax=Salipiger pentaromativorans TaxID=2943193 RepID=UPI0021581A0A|nr:PRC-barrel domain-containing protein [Salipiger pentaromativorans]MCR8547353.1 PRC-barrel domain-containing protein [Salipiger pentaromativorans]